MPFSIRPPRRFPVHCTVTYNAGPVQSHGSVRFSLALLLLIIALAVPTWADYEAGLHAYQRADYETALREWRPLAEQGHAGAQYYLGLCYDFKKGVPQDYALAREWYEKAAARDTPVRRTTLAGCMNSDTE